MRLQDLTKRRLERAANTALLRIVEADPSDTHKGAFTRIFHLTAPSDGMSGLTELWCGWIGGRSNEDRRAKYEALSYEKGLRTAKNAYALGHVSSYESMRPKFHEYQGAVLIGVYVKEIHVTEPQLLIVSTSGLAALNDQRTGLLTIELMDWASPAGTTQVCAVTGDDAYLQLLETVRNQRR